MTDTSLNVTLGRLRLRNPILTASGTFGYAREMAPFVDFKELGGIIPKTVTREPRIGNPPPRTIETASGMLNSIGLDNDGLDIFIQKHIPYLQELDTAVIANIAGRSVEDYQTMAAQLAPYDKLAGIELNISCPNVSGGVDYGTNPESTEEVVRAVRNACDHPIIAKLTPNITNIVPIADAAKRGGADAVSLINTLQGMAINWRTRKPILGNILGGLSGPAIKPVALRIVHQVKRAVDIPIIGVGGISSIDDVMEFLVTGASAVQVGTATFYNPSVSGTLTQQLRNVMQEQRIDCLEDFIGTLRIDQQPRSPVMESTNLSNS
ncbi:dihydroorotate dehydrogenase [uncultured Rubinisphaera sp.]|uniref:dihydroorotate dehydrogenase n=1 Tax=uncultured Rubinisphaera sp. TaxID=1678686 RepID=UPI0030D750CB